MSRPTYRVWITQEGTDDPVVFKLYENTLINEVSLQYEDVGRCSVISDYGAGEDSFVKVTVVKDGSGFFRSTEVLPVGNGTTRIYVYDINGEPVNGYQLMVELLSYSSAP